MAIKSIIFFSRNLGLSKSLATGICLSLFISGILIGQTGSRKSTSPGKSESELEITVATEKDKKRFNFGESIVLALNIKNNDDSDIHILQSCVALDYRLSVENEKEEIISLTEEGKRRTNRNEVICSLRKVRIKPGETVQETLNLSMLYDLSVKGTFYVNVSRSAKTSDNGWVQATSKTIRIVVD